MYPDLKIPTNSFLNSSKKEYELFLSYYNNNTLPFIHYPPISTNYNSYLIAKNFFYLSLFRPEIKIFFTKYINLI